MRSVIPIPRGVRTEELDAAVLLLRQRGVLRGRPAAFDTYDPVTWLGLARQSGVQLELILDRNILSPVLRLDEPLGSSDARVRLAAAVMLFATTVEADFDCTIAIGEEVSKTSDDHARDECLKFAGMQSTTPRIYADLFARRLNSIPRALVAAELTAGMRARSSALRFDASRWFLPEYTAALKLAILLRTHPPDAGAVLFEFLDWLNSDYLFLPGVLYASLAASPERHGGMFKSVRGPNYGNALAGIRNAAWDMGLLRYFSRRAGVGDFDGTFVMLCSADGALLDCASALFSGSSEPEQSYELLVRRWTDEWGSATAKDLVSRYRRYVLIHTVDSTRAASRFRNRRRHWDSLRAQLEADLARSF